MFYPLQVFDELSNSILTHFTKLVSIVDILCCVNDLIQANTSKYNQS